MGKDRATLIAMALAWGIALGMLHWQRQSAALFQSGSLPIQSHRVPTQTQARGTDRGRAWPLEGRITQEFGPTPFTFEPPAVYRGIEHKHFHAGLDIAAPLGTPIRAIDSGTVTYSGRIEDGALVVILLHDDGLYSIYGHLDDRIGTPLAAAGTHIQKGEVIGAIGMTGMTTGPHLHLTTYREELIDPRQVLQ